MRPAAALTSAIRCVLDGVPFGRIAVEVTIEDLDSGTRGDCHACPVALALSRAIGRPVFVDGDEAFIESGPDGWRAGVKLPEAAVAFIRRYDRGWIAGPFTFDIDMPGPAE